MARKGAVLLVVAGLAAIPALASATGPKRHRKPTVSVTPASGSPSTSFVVSFVAPDTTGRLGTIERRYGVGLTGPARSRCGSSTSMTLPPSARGARVHATLDPSKLAGRWCLGAFHGIVRELQSPVCPPGALCPLYLAVVRTVGRFSFRVSGTAPADTTPPRFAGIEQAFACTPGPQRPGQTTPFTLSWTAATDDVTPSSLIVYDVYVATAPGAEDFTKPNWTRAAGVTVFRTPGLASHGTFFFVVRARDQAGNEDRNRVERRGIDPCL